MHCESDICETGSIRHIVSDIGNSVLAYHLSLNMYLACIYSMSDLRDAIGYLPGMLCMDSTKIRNVCSMCAQLFKTFYRDEFRVNGFFKAR